MPEDLEKPLLDLENCNRGGIDLVSSALRKSSIQSPLFFLRYYSTKLSNSLFLQARLPLDEVFEQLRTTRRGLSSEDAEVRLKIFGPNKLEEKTVRSAVLKFL